MALHSYSNGRDLPEPRSPPRDSRSFEFCRAGAAAALPFCAAPPPTAAKAQSSGYQRLGKVASSAEAEAPPQRRPRLGWSALAFGTARVPAEMEMRDIRKRQRRRQRNFAEEAGVAPPPQCSGASVRGPWKLIRSLSCRGFESAAVVVATAAPLSFI